MTETTTKPLAREYLRVSRDKSGRARSIVEQQNDNRDRWGDRFVFNGDAYSDVSISASRYSTKSRGGWDALVSDLEAETFDADAIVLWEASRASRRTGEWARLIDACERAKVSIVVTMDGKVYDTTNARDRRTLREDASDAEYEADKLSARSTRAHAANAEAGRPAGKCPVGYLPVKDERTGRLINWEPDDTTDPEHPDRIPAAPWIRETYQRVNGGESLYSIAADLEERGVRTKAGKPYSARHLRNILVRETYMGVRVHNGEHHPATWPALVPKALWRSVNRRLNDPARKHTRPGRGKWLLSMIAICGKCEDDPEADRSPVSAFHRPHRVYRCKAKGCVQVNAADLDEVATEVIVAYLSDPERYARLSATSTDHEAVEAAEAVAEAIRAELDDLAAQVGAGAISATLAAKAEPGIVERLRAAEAELAALTTPSELADLVGSEEDVRARWEAAPMSAKRDVARLLLSPELVGELVVLPSNRYVNQPQPIAERMEFRRR